MAFDPVASAQLAVDNGNSTLAAYQAELATTTDPARQAELQQLIRAQTRQNGYNEQSLADALAAASANTPATPTTPATALPADTTPTQDTAQASIANQNPTGAATAAVDSANQLTTQEQVNLAAPNYNAVQVGGYDPNSDYYTGGGYTPPAAEPAAPQSPTTVTTSTSSTGDTVTTTQTGSTLNISGGAPNSVTPDVQSTGPIPNPLHDYPSYTYGLSLHMLTIDEYNAIVQQQSYTPNRVLIASAGRYNGVESISGGASSQGGISPNAPTFVRAKYFDVDFYFENLNMKTIIGTNDHSRATNAIDLSFNIIEPYGITLFNRIVTLCADLRLDNYLETPYLLQIDFYASNDAGEIVGVIPNQTKRIPIQLIKFDIKVTSKGAEYAIQAVPYNHSAFNLSTVSTPANFEVLAGSVASFFTSEQTEAYVDDGKSQRAQFEDTENAKINSNGTFIGRTGEVGGSILMSNPGQKASSTGKDPIYRVKSYGTAINAWHADLKKNNKVQFPDVYRFNFHPDIGTANFKLSGKLAPKDTAMANVNDTISIRQGNTGKEVGALNYDTRIFSINAGTSLEQVLNYVIRNSSYIQDQLVIPEEFTSDAELEQAKLKNQNLPLKWFKIIPTLQLDPRGYDKIRKVWARTITYNVIPYEIYNTKVDVAPQGTWNDPLKVYNYYYTGLNTDIIDVNIDFNALYYTSLTAYRNNLATLTGQPYDEQQNTDNAQGYDGITDDPNILTPIKQKPEVFNAKARATGAETSTRAAASVDTEQSLYTTAGGDMLQLSMKIVGDPQFIKQDDTFYAPTTSLDPTKPPLPSQDSRLIADGSMHMDSREVYVRVSYMNPSDIDEATGMMYYDPRFQQSLFSGMYKVLSVDSTFTGGKFEQTLELIRLPRQAKFDASTSANPRNNARTVAGSSVPGVAAITPDYSIGPNFSTPTTAGSTGDVTAPGSTPVADQTAIPATPDSVNLADVVNTAPSQSITDQTFGIPTAPNFSVSAYPDITNSIGGAQAITQAEATMPDFTPISIAGNQVPGAAAII